MSRCPLSTSATGRDDGAGAGEPLYTPFIMSEMPDNQPIGVVPVVRRASALMMGSVLVGMLLAVVWLVMRRPLGLPRTGFYRVLPITMIALPFVIGLPLWHWRVRRLRQALFASRFRLCTHCAYDLSTLAEVGTCPECGNEYDAARDVERWERTGAPYTEPRPTGFVPWSPPIAQVPPTH